MEVLYIYIKKKKSIVFVIPVLLHRITESLTMRGISESHLFDPYLRKPNSKLDIIDCIYGDFSTLLVIL